MMKRLVLALGVFLTLLVAFVIYYHFAADTPPPERGRRLPGEGASSLDEPPNPSGGKNLYLERRYDDGRMEAIYRAKRWTKLSEDRLSLVEPRVQCLAVDYADFPRAGMRDD